MGTDGRHDDAGAAGDRGSPLMREWIARAVAMFRKRSLHDRLAREVALHRELVAEDLAKVGSTSGEASSASWARGSFALQSHRTVPLCREVTTRSSPSGLKARP